MAMSHCMCHLAHQHMDSSIHKLEAREPHNMVAVRRPIRLGRLGATLEPLKTSPVHLNNSNKQMCMLLNCLLNCCGKSTCWRRCNKLSRRRSADTQTGEQLPKLKCVPVLHRRQNQLNQLLAGCTCVHQCLLRA